MTQFYKYPSNNRFGKGSGGFGFRHNQKSPQNGSLSPTIQKTDNKELIAKAIKQAALKTEHFRTAAVNAPVFKGAHFRSDNNPTRVSNPTRVDNRQAAPGKKTAEPNHKQRGGGNRSRRGGAFATEEVRLSTYKHKPRLRTGSDKDTLSKDARLKIMVLGGNEEVGRNMSLIEYKNDIILIDMGLQFPEDDMPGVDYIIPNISYLADKLKNIRGVIITHGHLDHIGAIPHLAPRLGNPPMFMSALTAGLVKKRQEDHRGVAPLKINVVKTSDVLQLGCFKIEFFRVSHNIPDSFGTVIHTPVGIVVHTGDFKIDTATSGDLPTEIEKIKKLGSQHVLALMADSTNAPQPGRQLTEGDIQHNIDDIIANAKGRIVIGTFSSMLGRIQQIIWACERMGRKVSIEGYSMKSNVAICQELGYMKIQKGTLIDVKQALKLPDNQVAIICTGAQGEDRAALMRIANGEHPNVQIEKGDTVVFSSSVIPGNERSVQRLKDTLYREGAEVVHYQMMDVHAGGHAKQEDLKLMHQMVNPKYLIPIEGNHSFLHMHAKAAAEGGIDPKNILIADNGQIMEFDKNGQGILTNKKVPTEYVFVDGLGVGDTNHVVLRDRLELSKDGMAIVLAVVSAQTGKLLKMPEIMTRGFVFTKEHDELMPMAKRKVANVLKDDDPRSSANGQYMKDKVREELGQFLFAKTGRRPMVLPMIIEV
ncbi:MAG: ribonuclease J [Patescibacteria group bacterium]